MSDKINIYKKITRDNTILLNGIKYKVYTIGNLPQSFGAIVDPVSGKEGVSEWFTDHKKGLVYIKK